MARAPSTTDPAKDAAALLRRLGFAVLMLILPSVALFSRRGVVLFLPIGVALLVIASALDGQFRPLRVSAERLGASTGVLAAIFAFVWAVLSLAWAPALGTSGERLLGLAASLGLGLAAYLSFPDRMRSANLYLVPVGTALAAAAAIASAVLPSGMVDLGDEDGRSLERGLSMVALLAWPAVAWLRSRDRDLEAICLVVVTAFATLIGPQPAISVAFAAGALAYVAVSLAPRFGPALVRTLIAVAILAAPLVPLVLAPAIMLLPRTEGLAEAFAAWKALVIGQPARLLTGHGFGAFVLARSEFTVAPATPNIPLVQIWYDLGVVGALSAGAAIWAGLRGAATSYAPLLPGVVAAFAAAFALSCAGIGSGQAWWPAGLIVVALAFVAAQRGQFRTRRPRARDLAGV